MVYVVPVLKQYTDGYGVWTYRDYRNNMIYNPDFYLCEKGWKTYGNVKFESLNNSMQCHMCAPAAIEQTIPEIRNHFNQDFFTVSFDVKEIITNGNIVVHMGNEEKSIEILREGIHTCTFPRNDSFDFFLDLQDGEMLIDSIQMYSFVQNGFLYDENNQELPFIDSIRLLNKNLSE